MNRRRFLLAAAGAAGLGLWALRPASRGAGGHDAYFEALSGALRAAGLARPVMIVDLDALDRNVDRALETIGERALRVVAKSLPSPRLIEHVLRRAGSDRAMVFHQPFVNALLEASPDVDQLLGKPMPVAAAARVYERMAGGAAAGRRVQWLIDSPERLRQYSELARAQGLRMRVNVELDVGLHRGGVATPAALADLIAAIDADPRLELSGLMGYEPHVVKMPGGEGAQAAEFERVLSRYRDFLDVARAGRSAAAPVDDLCLNAAGSPTFALWSPVDGLANELAIGSGFVKPLDFDIPTLASHEPALFIATPVLKASLGLSVPGLGALNGVWSTWDPNRRRTFFLYGGYWKARPVSPPGLASNPVFGHSSNQEMLNGSEDVELAVDDYVFLRPTQSEFVMLQFGDLVIVRGGRVVDRWPVLDASGAG